ncbi:MAG: SRPBCC family protein [Betaproteobacteria bacterium]|nr:SRPBCC family protein [Betaproteobacteria bacterium]
MPLRKVWALLANFRQSPIEGMDLVVEKKGDRENHDIGLIRKVTIGRLVVREVIEAVEPERSFRYRVLSGAPVRNYVGTVRLQGEGNKTAIEWAASMEPLIPLTGFLTARISRNVVARILDQFEAQHGQHAR